jgi:hypothetical protein
MANILPWLFWCTSAAVSSLASADLLLLDRQKKWISDRDRFLELARRSKGAKVPRIFA